MATFAFVRHPVTIFVKDYNNPDNLTNHLLILNSLILNKLLVLGDDAIRQEISQV